MDACSLSGSLHFIIASYDAAIADVVGNGIIEEDSVLGHDSNVRPEGDLGHLGPKDHMLWLSDSPQASAIRCASGKHMG